MNVSLSKILFSIIIIIIKLFIPQSLCNYLSNRDTEIIKNIAYNEINNTANKNSLKSVFQAVEILTILDDKEDSMKYCSYYDFSKSEEDIITAVKANNISSCSNNYVNKLANNYISNSIKSSEYIKLTNISKEISINDDLENINLNIDDIYSYIYFLTNTYNEDSSLKTIDNKTTINIVDFISTFKISNNMYAYNNNLTKEQVNNNSVLYSTFTALKVYAKIAKHSLDKNIINNILNNLVPEIIKELESLINTLSNKDYIKLFVDKKLSFYEINFYAIEALNSVLDAYNNYNYKENNNLNNFKDSITNMLISIANYFLDQKYNYHNLANSYYLIKSLYYTNKFPILILDKNYIINDSNNNNKLKEIDFVLKDSLGHNININNYNYIKITYNIKPISNNKSSNSLQSDDFELEDENISNTSVKNNELLLKNNYKGKIDLNQINTCGSYNIIFEIKFEAKDTKMYSSKYATTKNIKSNSNLKINSLSFNIIDSKNEEKEDLTKEIKIEFPKRSFKNYKANQNSILLVKIKLSAELNRPEQFFMRLRHNELNKLATGFATKYDKQFGHHIIKLDLSDHNIIDAYDGVYDMSIIISDPAIDNPVFWSFGKINIKFSKPLDPLSIKDSYKNEIKPKLEYTFNEENFNKSSIFSVLFSFFSLFAFIGYIMFLKNIEANLDNFPKNFNDKLYALLFILIIVIFGYLLLIFWIKLNILTTLTLIFLLSIPSSLIVYKTLAKVNIQI